MSKRQSDHRADPAYVQATQERRRSSASGIHGIHKGRNRQNQRRAAIRQSMRDER